MYIVMFHSCCSERQQLELFLPLKGFIVFLVAILFRLVLYYFVNAAFQPQIQLVVCYLESGGTNRYNGEQIHIVELFKIENTATTAVLYVGLAKSL